MDSDTWIDLLDPDADTVRSVVPDEVHPSALQHLLAEPRHDDEPRPRLETHGEHLFGVLVVPQFLPAEDRVVFQEVDLIATATQLVTVRKTPPGGEPLRFDDLRTASGAEHASSGLCLFHVFDEVAERFLDLVDDFDDSVDELEDHVEEWPAAQVRARISSLRHDILHVRRALAPTRDAARAILDNRVEIEGDAELFPRDVEIRFADAYDKLLRATDGLDLSRDLLAGVRDYHQAQVANDQNEVMKRLTVVASVLLLPTFIVGLYGQNLKNVPELSWRYGYAFSWALIIVTTIAQLAYFRRKRWI